MANGDVCPLSGHGHRKQSEQKNKANTNSKLTPEWMPLNAHQSKRSATWQGYQRSGDPNLGN